LENILDRKAVLSGHSFGGSIGESVAAHFLPIVAISAPGIALSHEL